MDDSDPSIVIGHEGRCNHCSDYLGKITFSGGELKAFEAKLEKARRSHLKFNCIIGLSGGLDSTFLAIHAVKDLGLRPLAIHMDNGWNTGLAADNIKRTIDALGLTLETEVLDWEEFRKMQISVFKAGVPDLEAATDLFINFTLRKYAKKYGIDIVLSGSNPQTEGVMSNDWSYGQRDPIYIKALYQYCWRESPTKLPLMSLGRSLYQQVKKEYTVLRPLRFINYGRKIAVERSKREVEWQEYDRKHGESFITRYYQDIFLPSRFGVDKRRAHYSSLILNSEITRGDALAKMNEKVSPESIEADIAFLCMKLEITRDEYDQFMASEIRSYRDYYSIHKTFIYRFLKLMIAKDGAFKWVYSFLGDLLRR